MKIEALLQTEETNVSHIFLYKEGVFWKAYQRSAYALLRHCEVKYLVKHRYVKCVAVDVFFVGFPETALARLFDGDRLEHLDEKRICIALSAPICVEDYDAWAGEQMKSALPTDSAVSAPQEVQAGADAVHVVIDRLKTFNTAASTPLECLLLVAEMQKMLQQSIRQ